MKRLKNSEVTSIADMKYSDEEIIEDNEERIRGQENESV